MIVLFQAEQPIPQPTRLTPNVSVIVIFFSRHVGRCLVGRKATQDCAPSDTHSLKIVAALRGSREPTPDIKAPIGHRRFQQ
jgi:hypothetical protein